MDKEYILSAIKRTAIENDGRPLGIDRFREETGIRKEDWYGIYWAKWSDAQIEAGFAPNHFGAEPLDQEWMISKIVEFTRELGHLPTKPELKLRKRQDDELPSHVTIARHLGKKAQMIDRILDYCESHEGSSDVTEILLSARESLRSRKEPIGSTGEIGNEEGHVYLLKHGKSYKIRKKHGRCEALQRD